MGPKLTVLARALIAGLALASAAHADTSAKSPAADDVKRGIELFKAGKYADAAAAFTAAYAAEPKLDTLFALAQAERLAGDCPHAAAHYHQVIEQQSDLAIAKLVQQNLQLCEPEKPAEPVKEAPPPPPPPPAPPPKIITKIVTHDVPHTDPLVMALGGSGALALGTGIGLFVAARSDRDAADRADSLADHDSIADRSRTEKLLGYVIAGSGVALVGGAVVRWLTSNHAARDSEVTVTPTAGGGAVSVSGRF